MINPYLKARLLPVWQRYQGWRMLWSLAFWLALGAAVGWLLLLAGPGSLPIWALPLWIGTTLAGACAVWLGSRLAKPDFRSLARRLEFSQPSLDGRLLTALELNSTDEPEFIKERLLQQTIQHSLDHEWLNHVTIRAVSVARAGCCIAGLACLAIMLAVTTASLRSGAPSESSLAGMPDGIEVTPGDTSLERGNSLLVMARFSHPLPTAVELITGNTPESERSQLLVRSLNDPVFGGSVPDVAEGFRYHISYGGKRSRDFSVKVFEFPRLDRSDIILTYPAWTGLTEKRTEDSHRASAVEGTRLGLDLQLNKPVSSAILKPRSKGMGDVALTVDPLKAIASLRDFVITSSQVYDLILTDSEARSNKVPATFTIEALPNRTPVLKLASPRGDQRPSALEELVFEGTARDDFGLLAWGLSITKGGGEPQIVELGKAAPVSEKQSFHYLLRLEESGAKPDDLLSWSVWADDIGPDGKPRRTYSDLGFGEVRPFDEIYRQGEEAAGDPPPGEPASAPAGSPAAKLAELQKQIINATWKLHRASSPAPADVKVVRDSQVDALGQATEAATEVTDARLAGAWEVAKAAMTKAGEALQAVVDQPSPLHPALAAEQSAYQALLALSAREHRISKSKGKGGPPSAAEQQRQEELDQLDLTKEENRYETKSEAASPAAAEQREQRQVLSRLQELAKRQEEVNEKLKELQTALQAAESEAQKEALKRELKRLEEEQRQTLADVDELSQRMEKPESQEKLAQEKKALEEARQNVQDAAQATAEGNVPRALASGTRAERQLQEMREDLRKKSSTALAQELRDMRAAARELASQQQKATEQLAEIQAPRQKSLSEGPEREAARQQLAEQQQRAEGLTKRANALSSETESSEPLVSRQLYDTIRKFSQEDAAAIKGTQEKLIRDGQMTRKFMDELTELQQNPDAAKTLQLTAGLLEQNLLDEAKASSTLAGTGIENMKSGIERATESVLGDDTEALKRADQELSSLAEAIEQELAQGQGAPGHPSNNENPDASTKAPDEGVPPIDSKGPGEGKPPAESATASAEGKGEGKGNDQAQGQGKSSGQSKEPSPSQAAAGGPDASGPGNPGQARGSSPSAGGGRGSASAPIAGDGYAPWSERLRDVEEMVDFPDLRNSLANARERARQMRVEAKRDLKKPDWAVVKSEILDPLVQVRNQVREEVARRASDEALVPIDRDPVPGRYSELVRRYYEQLGKEP